MDASLSWCAHIDYICSKAQQRINFFRRLRSFGEDKQILLLFFQSIVQSVILYGSTAWYSCLSVQLQTRLGRLIRICSKIVGQALEPNFQAAYTRRMLSWQAVLRLPRPIFCWRNISFCHQTED